MRDHDICAGTVTNVCGIAGDETKVCLCPSSICCARAAVGNSNGSAVPSASSDSAKRCDGRLTNVASGNINSVSRNAYAASCTDNIQAVSGLGEAVSSFNLTSARELNKARRLKRRP